MTSKTSDTYATQFRLCHAQRWLFRWAITRELEARAYGEEIEITDGMDVMLPAARQVTLIGPSQPGGPALHIACDVTHNGTSFRHGGAAELVRWLYEGVAPQPARIAVDVGGSFVGVDVALQAIDWHQPDYLIAEIVDALVGYVTRVRKYLQALNAQPSLDLEEAIRLRLRFQSELAFYPTVTQLEPSRSHPSTRP